MGAEFEGLTALVTGGASGIGLATAMEVATRGTRVATLDLNPQVSEPPHGLKADVTDGAELRRAVDEVAGRLGGIGARGTVADNDLDAWHRVFDVVVDGIVGVVRACLLYFRRASHAAIVNTCSLVGWARLPQRAPHSATKCTVLALTMAMAADHVAERNRVNCVSPGIVDTPWVVRLLAAARDPWAEAAALEARQPMGRLVTAEEVAAAIANLASSAVSGTTGTALAVDGGMFGPCTRR
jgi:NAD(P)-dependent dehydrogenase (short-subunit alcohol dehydrogenase family)